MTDYQQLISDEYERQASGLELIPSENYVSQSVLKALGSVYTNKYAEGYPGQRYYGGQINTDRVEREAIDAAKALFKADHANIQPHSGAQANEAAYWAWLEPGDTVLAMDLSHGGHLTHGHPVTILAKQFNFVRYRMKNIETGEIDYDQMRELAKQHRPKIILAGFSAYPRELDYGAMADIASEVDAVAMADIAHIAGLIAAGILANPFDHGFHMMTTTTHKTLRGPRGGMILSRGQVGNPLKKPDKTVANLPTLIDRSVFPGIQGGPHMHTILAKLVALQEAGRPEFKNYAQTVVANAKALAAAMQDQGFKLITNGTDNHLILCDVVTSFGVDGAEAEQAIDAIGLSLNKNVIPDDPNPPARPSGIRLGTPALTTRGLKPEHMPQLAQWLKAAITERNESAEIERLRNEVAEFCRQFPLP